MRRSFAKRVTLAILALALPALGSVIRPLIAQEAAVQETKPAEKEAAAKKPAAPKFVRLKKGEKNELLALETAVVSYVPADASAAKVSVVLIGAVHVGDKVYYEKLNTEFEKYEALLFELVAPAGTKIPKDRPKSSPGSVIGATQIGMKDMLGLEFQLDHIDYSKANFVHADMSPEEFSKTMTDRGESFAQMFFRSMGAGIATQSKNPAKSNDLNVLMAFLSKDRERALKAAMAEQLGEMDAQMKAIEGPQGSTILGERNGKAFGVLRKELDAGKKTIGVFYGAAHLPDMEERLIRDFGLKRSEERWFEAWSLVPKNEAK